MNEQIRVPEVRVIDAKGQQLGILPTAEAINAARAQGLDLVEVSPKANPPVVKFINYDKFRYQQNKLAQQQRKNQKKIEVKGIRLSMRTGIHDLEFKARAADKFLKAGNKIKIDMFLRGRERANVPYALDQVKKFLGLVTAPHVVEMYPKVLGNMINSFLAPK
ncbi:MAG: translation initiation factor IF-3 [Candidatus Doudnabacteria bacterium RIFCSPHIGHO2_01_FULL_50_11]|uniref:Translation initiation factor IF-3 n=1 Tax=Candidatus Doudnabacteria bacterium RIFCSPHIGHO2_01_FULL_50_11 TaxID=1817828 RepID=A0A1F5PJ31_9BACT|nr:MAG: translation initiation factor IF-3 [Candidatus Doudnabacteria bacterium RIFCSPHIGHO2_01_FULL_50_11]HLC45176.1 translation initiation factor IF-3 [Patescibacteria group bacterium]